MERDPVRADRGDDDRRLRDRLRARLRLHPRRVPRAAARARGGARRGARAAATSATTSSARASRFDIEIRKGAGAYICGEETAIFESIEGNRGEPRNKPPFPVVEGLFGKPTVVNNVETLVNVLDIVLRSGPSYAETGTEVSTGTKLFCLSGHVERPGVYEVPFGTTLRELLDARGRRRRRQGAPVHPHGRRRRRLPAARTSSTCRSRFEARARGEDDARLGRRPRARRDRRPAAAAAAHRRVLPQRVVRPVRPLPRRHRAPAGGARAARLRARRSAASRRSSR